MMETKDFYLLGKMIRELVRVLKKRFIDFNDGEITISIEQFGLLQAISLEEEDVIQNDMAKLMGKDKSAILRTIDSLEKMDLIRRVVDSKDRRKNYLMVTKIGHRTIKEYTEIINKLLLEMNEGINKSDTDAFVRVVNHFIIKTGGL